MIRKLYWILVVLCLNACSSVAQLDPDTPRTIHSTDNQSGIIRVTVPGDWPHILERTHSITISNEGRALRDYNGTMTHAETGEIVGSILAQTKATLPDNVDDSPSGIMNFVIGALTRESARDTSYSFGVVKITTIGDYDAFYSDGLATAPDAAHDLRLIVLDTQLAYGILLFGAPFDELVAYAETINTIAASFAFEPLD